jgi:hypothetical protein
MRNFPVPYPNELIYSTVARASIYHGITSPKQLLDEVFNNRKVIATLDLPCHLQSLSQQLKSTGRFAVEELIYRHTMFPLYAPFVTEPQRARAMQLMAGRSQGAVHLLVGVAASRVKTDDRLRYCSECLKVQFQQYGENFWQRNWFFPGLNLCPEHGALHLFAVGTTEQRHQFHALNVKIPNLMNDVPINSDLMHLAKYASQLIAMEPEYSPSFSQWTTFYHDLALDLRLCRGKHIKHDEVYSRISDAFHHKTFEQLRLQINPSRDSCWLKSIFRKHRKAFSYLEHALVWRALIPDLSTKEIVAVVCKIKPNNKFFCSTTEQQKVNNQDLLRKRQLWQQAVLEMGVTAARKFGKGKALYAWLYRNDRTWLLHFNAKHQQVRSTPQQKADWRQRDLMIVRRLFRALPSIEINSSAPRLSANYLLSQLNNKSTVEKNLDKLPLVKSFLQRYSETITEYQLRRLSNACIQIYRDTGQLKNWVVLRQARLSKERLTADSQRVLAELRLF